MAPQAGERDAPAADQQPAVGSRNRWWGWGALTALAAVAAAALLQLTVPGEVAEQYPFFPYFLAVVATLWIAGRPAGLLAAVLGLMTALVLHAPPSELGATLTDPAMLVRVAVFFVVCGAAVALDQSMRIARRRAASLAVAVWAAWREVEQAGVDRQLAQTAERAQRAQLEAAADQMEQWRALMDAIIETAPLGIGVYDKGFHFIRVNRALAAFTGLPVEAHAGRSVLELLPDLEPEVHDAFQRVLRTGQPLVGAELHGRTPAGPGRRTWSVNAYPVAVHGDPVFAVAAVIEDVTDRRQTQARLEASEERYRSLVEAITAIVCVADADGRFTTPQPSWEAYTGQAWAQHRDYGYLDAIHSADRDATAAAWAEARAEQRVFEHAARLRHAATRTYRHCTARVVPVTDADGSVREWVSSIVDNHEAVVAQERLRTSEARFREMANLIPQAVWTARPDGVLDYFNQQWLDFVGVSAEEAHRTGWERFIHPDDLPRMQRAWAEALRTETPLEIEFRQHGRDGRHRWFLGRAVPVRDRWGTVLRWLGTSTDIDEKKRAEEALRTERDVVETVHRVGRALSAELDLEKLLHAITTAGARLTGAELATFVRADPTGGEDATVVAAGGSGADVRAWGRAPGGAALHEAVLRDRRVVRVGDLHAGRAAPGPETHAAGEGVRSCLAVPVVSRSGEVLGGLFFGHGRPHAFGERHEQLLSGLAAQAAIAIDNARLFEAEREARGAAETANRAKDEFLSILSHELRTPLTAMLGWTRLLREGRVKPERVQTALETVDRSGWALARMVDDLLDVSRIVTGRTRLDVQPVDLRTVLEAAAATIRPTADSKRVAFDVRLEHAARSLVAGDAGRLQQVVWNLLANAVKFTPAGGHVELALDSDATHAHVVVRDTGAGITAEFLPHVFERFRQGDPTSHRQHGGLGLGLAIVRHLVELHGGDVHAASDGPGRGAGFTVTLPLAAEALRGPSAVPDRAAPGREGASRVEERAHHRG